MKKVLITGATSGLGLDFTKYYAQRGYHVYLLGRNNDKLLELREMYPAVTIYCVDLANEEKLNYWLGEIKETFFDIVINNAGFGDHGEFVSSNLYKQEQMIKTNILALTKIAHVVLNRMKQEGYGYLLNIGSVAGFMPGPEMSVYYATKSYVNNFTQALHEEFKGTNIHISCLCPGPTKTAFNKNAGVNRENLLKENDSKKLFFIKNGVSEEVVKMGIEGLNQNKALTIPYTANKVLVFTTRVLPRSVLTYAVKKIMHTRHSKKG